MNKSFSFFFLAIILNVAGVHVYACNGQSTKQSSYFSKKNFYSGIDFKNRRAQLEIYNTQGSNAGYNEFQKILGCLFFEVNKGNAQLYWLLKNQLLSGCLLTHQYLFDIYPSHNFW